MEHSVSVAILAAGLGTRMKSKKAKVLHRAGGLILAEHVVRAATAIAPAGRIAVVVGHQGDQVRAALPHSGLAFAEQTEQKGTGHALLMARAALEPHGGRVVVLYGDSPLLLGDTLRRLIAEHEASGAAATVISTHLADPTGYGRIVRDGSGAVAAIVEEKAATPEQRAIREINSGIYCFEADLLWSLLPSIAPNPASGEIYLTDMVEALNRRGKRVQPMVIEDASELLGINTRVELAEADTILRDRKTRELMLDGVTIERPATVTIDMDVRIGRDTVVEPFAQILGNTVVGEDCRIGTGAIIRDSTLDAGVQVEAYTIIRTSRLETGAQAGPFARLRADNHLGEGARVGNFVELKKTSLGAGSKAMHLAYLGDSTIGSRVNIGAGTITCNYDGRVKSPTRIASNAFVGSNSTLVAPLEIGEGAYIAAGSVITDTVPEDTLALGRSRQVTKEGWPSRRKSKP